MENETPFGKFEIKCKVGSSKMDLRSWQLESIAAIRSWGNAFDSWTDEQIAEFYSYWSEQTFAAGWLCRGEKMFYDYATHTPLSLWGKEHSIIHVLSAEAILAETPGEVLLSEFHT